jgi:tetratricopeptide (TPR) repeat protein
LIRPSPILATVLCTLLLARGAHADDPEAARRHFEQGTVLYNSQDYALALAEFEAAYEAKPHPTVLRNIAAAQEALRRYPAAIATLEHYLRDATGREFRGERAAVEAHLAALRNLVGRIVVATEPDGTSISIDGDAMGESPLAAPLEVAHGHHVIEVSHEGYDVARQDVEVPPGGETRVEIRPIPRMARLTVDTSAPHAMVAVDGAVSGPAPWAAALLPGRHVVRVTAPGRRATRMSVDLGPGSERSLVVQLDTGGPQGMLALNVAPVAGARAVVDGRPLGFGTDQAMALEQGLHRVVVTGPDRVTYEGNVRVRANRLTHLRVHLTEERFYVAPIWGTLSSVATALLAAGTVYYGLRSLKSASDYDDPDTVTNDLQRLYDDHDRFARAANNSLVGAAIFGIGSVLLFYWSRGGAPESTGLVELAPIQ